MTLWLPESYRVEEQVDHTLRQFQRVRGLLKQMDPRLDLVLASDRATNERLRPGYWHVRLDLGPLPPSYMPITTPGGGYREPDAAVVDELMARRMDRTRDGVADLFARKDRGQRAADRDAARKTAARREEMADYIHTLDFKGRGVVKSKENL